VLRLNPRASAGERCMRASLGGRFSNRNSKAVGDLSTYNQVIENTGMSAGEHDSGDGPRVCLERGVGRVPTRSAQLVNGEGRGPNIGWNGSFPPASEREARMDDHHFRDGLAYECKSLIS